MSDDNIHVLPMTTRLPLTPERVLSAALKEPLKRVLVIGVEEDGTEYFATSEPDGAVMLWDMERCRHRLMKNADEA